MIKNKFSRGFTLIELLIVIAIIGILSSVVLASLNSARAKGADASVKSNLSSVRAQAELYYDNQTPNSYGGSVQAAGTCPTTAVGNMFGDTTIQNALKEAANAGGGGWPAGTRCWTDGNNYVMSVRLKTNTAAHWCTDSTGVARQVTTLSWGGPTCPTT